MSFGGTLMEAELDDAAEGGEAGNRLPHTVDNAWFASVQHRFALTGRLGAVVRGDVQHRGDAFSDVRAHIAWRPAAGPLRFPRAPRALLPAENLV